MTYINRDPFARQELHREIVSNTVCSWCGTKGKHMFQYRTETDGGRKYTHSGVFCSKGCHDAYHDTGWPE